MKNMSSTMTLIESLAAEEAKLSQSLFLAPVLESGEVHVRVAGLLYKLKVEDTAFAGWALLKITEPGRAAIIGTPGPRQIREYLALLPRLKVVLLGQFKNSWWGLQASPAAKNFRLDAPVPLKMASAAGCFDTACARFDGASFFFEGADRRRDPSIARHLRQALQDDTAPWALHCKGMVKQERLAYEILWGRKHRGMRLPSSDLSDADRLSRALAHAGATLDAFWQAADDQITVRYVVDGRTRTSNVREGDLTVVSSGICLSGKDMKFDLTSLVGVMREQANREYPEY